MAEHELKTWPALFAAMWHEARRFEVRRDDRGFAVGDTLWLREWNPETREYTGRELRGVVVRFILRGSEVEGFGIRPGYCVMSTHVVSAGCYIRPAKYDWDRDFAEMQSLWPERP